MAKAVGIERWLPGISLLRTYQADWLRSDLVAGVSVAAVAMPIGIAYAQLAGFPPVVGLYSSILPAVAYAIFGSSRQLVVNPDAAACTIVASTLAPLAAGDPGRYGDLSIALTIMTGILCILAGVARLGVIANFLSRPILTGYLNGIALSIIASQLGTLLGFKVEHAGFFRTIADVFSRLGETHLPTFAVGLSLFAALRLLRRLAPKIPAPLVVAALGTGAVYALDLGQLGVSVVGEVPAGFPSPRLPSVAAADLPALMFGACGIVLVSFCSMMTTAQGFAAKNGYAIDANQDFVALGVADLSSGLSQGFVVSGADSRTAVADAAGGKTQVTSLVAAATMALVLLFLTKPLAFLPGAALAAILMASALGLFDIASLRQYRRLSAPEFRSAIVAMLGVMTVGVLPGVLIAVGLALLRLVMLASRPNDAVLGFAGSEQGDHVVEIAAGGKAIPGLLIYRFDAALLFFNAGHFQERVRELVATSDPKPQWFLFDAESINLLDISAAHTLESLRIELADHGVVLCVTRAKGLFRAMLEQTGVAERMGAEHQFPSVHAGVQAFLRRDASGELLGRSAEIPKGKKEPLCHP